MDSIDDFESILIDTEIMILKSRLIFLQKRLADVLPNVLMGQDLQEEIKCDYKYQLIKGPFANTGQK